MNRLVTTIASIVLVSVLPAYAERIELKCKTSKMTNYFTYVVDTIQGTVRDEHGTFETVYFSPAKIIFRKKYNYKTHQSIYTYDIDRANLDYRLVFRHDCYYQNSGSECDTTTGFGKCFINNPETRF
jgi:hypothetical protein